MTISRQAKIDYKINFLMHIRKTNKTRLIRVVVLFLFVLFLQNSVLGNLVGKDIDLQVQ